MQHMFFTADTSSAQIALLIKTDSFNKQQLEHFYINPLEQLGVPRNAIVAFDLEYPANNKLKAADAKTYTEGLLKALDHLNIKLLVVCDSNYFTRITGESAAKSRGYVKHATHPYKHIQVIASSNYNAIYHNESIKEEINRSLMLTHTQFINLALDTGDVANLFQQTIIQSASYPSSVQEITDFLESLYKYPTLTCDIETFSLRFEKSGIGSIGFAWNMHNGGAFIVDTDQSTVNTEVRAALKEFFISYKGVLIFHNILFDAKILIYQLFMEHDSDWVGMRQGLEIFSKCDDSMVIAFLATNTSGTNSIGLKDLAYTFSGDYAVDVKDITKLAVPDLLEYNLVDCLNTWYVYEKYLPMAVQDNQLNFYTTIAKPSLKIAIKMMLTGLPMDMRQVLKTKHKVTMLNLKYRAQVLSNPYVKQAEFIVNKQNWIKANAKLKKKHKPMSDFNDSFNPNSDAQLRVLIYDVLKLPVLDTTDSGEASTSGKVIKRLMEHSDAAEHVNLLKNLVALSETETILNTFINAFEEFAFTRHTNDSFDETVWLNGSLKTVGVKSGRWSGSDPNLTNLGYRASIQ